MSGTTSTEPISFGRYEPEGIYLASPFSAPKLVVQQWGENPEFYADYTYNGVPLKGYIGLGFDAPEGTRILAMDRGRVTEVSIDPGGLGRYIKIEHRWGETLYACLRTISVESGGTVERGRLLGTSGIVMALQQPRFHLGMRILPYNRFDGWGGFSDPLPYMNPQAIRFLPIENNIFGTNPQTYPPFPMSAENSGMRRP